MRVVIAGSSGLVGTALTRSLAADGHQVLRLVRRPPAGAEELRWNPAAGDIDPMPLEGVDAVVNLGGAGINEHRWTKGFKETLRSSRIHTTSVLSTALARLDTPPRVLISASGVNFYGRDHGAQILDEDFPAGKGFLSHLCQDWEAATEPAAAAGIAVCRARFGLVMDRRGGSLAKMLPLFRLGLGGPLAGGQQYWSFISLPDAVRALRLLLETPGSVGPYNITGPEPVTNAEFTRVLAHGVRRPAMLPAPELALRVVIGDLTGHIVGSLRVLPRRLAEAGFQFHHPDARAVVAAALHE